MDPNFFAYRIFVSSPGDVDEERKIVEDVTYKVAQVCREPLGLSPEIIKWENMVPAAPAEETIQEIINRELKKYHASSCVFGDRRSYPMAVISTTNSFRVCLNA